LTRLPGPGMELAWGTCDRILQIFWWKMAKIMFDSFPIWRRRFRINFLKVKTKSQSILNLKLKNKSIFGWWGHSLAVSLKHLWKNFVFCVFNLNFQISIYLKHLSCCLLFFDFCGRTRNKFLFFGETFLKKKNFLNSSRGSFRCRNWRCMIVITLQYLYETKITFSI